MSEIAKTYEPAAVEAKWYDFWLQQGCFTADPARVSDTRPAYSIVIPPPNVTGVLTLGHVLNNTIQDILARRARMLGKEVLWLPGTDHAGIATQNVVEKTLRKSGEIKHRDDLGREALVAKIWEWKEKYGGIILQQLRALGASCDWSRTRFTMDEDYSRCVSRVFVDLYHKGLIYRGKRMVNWCPASLTALSDEEVVMKEQNGTLYYFNVRVVGSRDSVSPGEPDNLRFAGPTLTIATTRPETIPGDTAIAVNPNDARYAHLIGQYALRPLPVEVPDSEKLIPIIGSESVAFDFGTGVLKVTPAHDKTDYEIGLRHGLPQVDIMHPNGVMNDRAGADLRGLERFAARKRAAELLTELGAMEKEEPYKNNVGYSERADVPIEPRLSEQWFLKYPSVEAAHACVASGSAGFQPAGSGILPDIPSTPGAAAISPGATSAGHQSPAGMPAVTGRMPALPGMRFYPERWAKVYDHWMTGIQDWCISRQLWWGHRIPVWYRRSPDSPSGKTSSLPANLSSASNELISGSGAILSGSGKTSSRSDEVISTGDELLSGNDEMLSGNGKRSQSFDQIRTGDAAQKSPIDAISFVNADGDLYVGVEPPHDVEQWIQDPDVLDTWFSSWLWPFATMGWPEKTVTLKAFYPTTDLVTGPDIIFFWVARMIMAGFEYMGELPFRNVYFTGIIRDKQGRKMSKSLGNSPDPLDLIAKYGADALRFGVMRSAPLGADILFDEKNVELGRNFCTKLWNATRFRQMQTGPVEAEIHANLLTSDDKWILLRLDAAIREVSAALDEYRFSDAANALYRFFWSEFCDWYLETTKAAFFGEVETRKFNTLAVLDFVLGHTLRLMHPFLPFITEELWHDLLFHEDLPDEQGGKTIMTARWPAPLDEDFKAHYGLTAADEQFANAKYEVVNLGRGLRRDFNIASSKRVRFVLRPSAPLPAHEAEVLRILLNAEPLDVLTAYTAPKGTPTALTPLGELYLPLEGLIDAAAERERLAREIAKVEDELAKVRTKLADPNFAAKVPAKILGDHRQREATWAEKLAQLTKMREALGGA